MALKVMCSDNGNAYYNKQKTIDLQHHNVFHKNMTQNINWLIQSKLVSGSKELSSILQHTYQNTIFEFFKLTIKRDSHTNV